MTTATPVRTLADVEAEALRVAAFQACGDCPELTPRDHRRIVQDIEAEIRTRRLRLTPLC